MRSDDTVGIFEQKTLVEAGVGRGVDVGGGDGRICGGGHVQEWQDGRCGGGEWERGHVTVEC